MKSLERECRWEGASQVALVVENLPADARAIRDEGLIPGSGRPPGEGNDNPPQYSCLENPMDGVDYTVHGVAKSQTQLSNLTNFQSALVFGFKDSPS